MKSGDKVRAYNGLDLVSDAANVTCAPTVRKWRAFQFGGQTKLNPSPEHVSV